MRAPHEASEGSERWEERGVQLRTAASLCGAPQCPFPTCPAAWGGGRSSVLPQLPAWLPAPGLDSDPKDGCSQSHPGRFWSPAPHRPRPLQVPAPCAQQNRRGDAQSSGCSPRLSFQRTVRALRDSTGLWPLPRQGAIVGVDSSNPGCPGPRPVCSLCPPPWPCTVKLSTAACVDGRGASQPSHQTPQSRPPSSLLGIVPKSTVDRVKAVNSINKQHRT